MKQTRAPFMPVSPDIDDAALESLARDKGVGALVKPVANRVGEGAQQSTVAPSERPAPSSRILTTVDDAASTDATPRTRMKAVNFELPDYAWTELKILAAREQVSVRHIIMMALKARGIVISDSDLVEDGRRLRN